MNRIVQFAAFVFFSSGCLCQATMIADWTFETSQPNGSGTTISGIIAESGVNAAISIASGCHANSSTAWTSPKGYSGTANSFSGNRWSAGDYFQFQTSTVGFKDITIVFEQMSSDSGPSAFQLAYSTDNSTYFNMPSGSYSVNNTSWSTGSLKNFDLTLTDAINNSSTVFFRLIDTGNSAAGSDSVKWQGTSRIDDFTVSGVAMVPEPVAGGWISATVLLALCGFGLWQRHALRCSFTD